MNNILAKIYQKLNHDKWEHFMKIIFSVFETVYNHKKIIDGVLKRYLRLSFLNLFKLNFIV